MQGIQIALYKFTELITPESEQGDVEHLTTPMDH